MTRHIADRRSPSQARATRFAEVERHNGPEGSHPAVKTLTRRPRDEAETRRVAEFARIARGRET